MVFNICLKVLKKRFKSLTICRNDMAEFVKAIKDAEDNFRKKLPELLQEASKKIEPYTLKQQGVTTKLEEIILIERTEPYGAGLHGYVCKLTVDGIEHISSTYNGSGTGGNSSTRKASYEQFAKECNFVDLSIVAEKLAKLGL